MTQEEKDLLIKDICGRLPYKPILINKQLGGGYPQKCFPGYLVFGKFIDSSKIDDTKIYLRSMSSMTEEEKKEYNSYHSHPDNIGDSPWFYIDWLNAHHFDYRGLIEKGLALEAPEGMYEF